MYLVNCHRNYRYAYDALNRNTIKDIPGGTANDVYYAYDARGLQASALFASASGVGITNSYDGFGELLSTTNNMGTTARTLSYTYDADGNRSQLTYPDSTYFTYVYDGLDRLTTIKEAGATAIVSTVYDAQGRVGSQTRGAVTTTLGYDAVSRPTSWADDLTGTTSDVTSTFAYNPASQIVTKTRSNDAYAFNAYVSVSRPYAVNGLNQYATAGSATFTYDDNGDLTGDGTNSYGYDVENRMISATTAIGAITLKYDPLGRLRQYAFPTKTWEYTYDGDAMVMAVNPNATVKIVHGPNEDDPMIQYTGAGYSARSSLQADYQGSIVSTADATGAKTYINTYDEYGISPSTNGGLFQYTGQLWLGQVGLYYYKARMYSPTLGRFMQTDPIGYKDQNNLYAYVGNDPIGGRDPTGLYLCGGNKSQCGAVREALALATKALGSDKISKSERRQLSEAVKFYGAEGKSNGVVVMFGSKQQLYEGSGGRTTGAFTAPTREGRIMVALPNDFATNYDESNKNPGYSRLVGRDMRAYAIVHEGDHGMRFANGATLREYQKNWPEWEHTARVRGSIVTKALGSQSICEADKDC